MPEKQEYKYTKCQYIKEPLSIDCSYSKLLLRQYCPHEDQYTPLFVTGDGNCLFHATSVLLCGSEEMSSELRLRTLIELSHNKQFYCSQLVFLQFADVAGYDESVMDCSCIGGYSSIWTMCGLSTVVSRPIESIFPYVNGRDDVAASICNVIINPRRTEYVGLSCLKIFWTRLQVQNTRLKWSPNHFVPLVIDCQPVEAIHSDGTIATEPEVIIPVAVVVEDDIEPEPVEFNLCDFITESEPTEDSELESVIPELLVLQAEISTDPFCSQVHDFFNSEDVEEVITLLEPYKRGIRLCFAGYTYIRDRAKKSTQ